MTRSLAAASLLALSACAVGPKYQRPEVETPQSFRFTLDATTAASIADLPWWETYTDAHLQALIREALANNQDLRLATARVATSRALVGVARSDFFPQVDVQLGAAYGQRLPRTVFPGVDTTAYFTGSANVSWEIDIWGRVRNQTEAAQAEWLASEEGRRATVLSLVGDVAQAYAELLELDAELEIARVNTVVRQGTVDLFTKRSVGGVGNDLEVNQARADLAVTAAAIPSAERLIALKENQLGLLLGRPPGPVARGTAPQRSVPAAIPLGVPAALLERRPDVKAAEQQVIQYNALVGVAIANRLPTLSLGGSIGLAGTTVPNTFSPDGLLWNLAAGLLAPVFQGGRLSSEEEAAWARRDLYVAAYRQTVLTAWREVSDAAVSVRKLQEVAVEREKQVVAARTAERLARLRYEGGVSNYLEVLDAQRSTFNAELALTQANRDTQVALVQLYRALGGGWQEALEARAADAGSPPATGQVARVEAGPDGGVR